MIAPASHRCRLGHYACFSEACAEEAGIRASYGAQPPAPYTIDEAIRDGVTIHSMVQRGRTVHVAWTHTPNSSDRRHSQGRTVNDALEEVARAAAIRRGRAA